MTLVRFRHDLVETITPLLIFFLGVLHSYMYSQLYNPNSKIIVRTTVC